MESRSLCLVDAAVVIDGCRTGYLETLIRTYRVGIAASMCRTIRHWRDDDGNCQIIDIDLMLERGILERVDATVAELEAVARVVPYERIGFGELEMLAIWYLRKDAWMLVEDPLIHELAMRVDGARRVERYFANDQSNSAGPTVDGRRLTAEK